MEEVIGFNNLKLGQRVKVKGKLGSEGIFTALEIDLRTSKGQAAITGLLQHVDLRRNALHVLDRSILLPDNVVITDLNDRATSIVDLKPMSQLKLKGRYSGLEGFVPERIEVKETITGFNIDKLEGVIDHLDAENKTLRVIGFTVTANRKTVIEGI
jgi:hypothetical protein